MNWLSAILLSRVLASALLLLVSGAGISVYVFAAGNIEFIRGGGFEQGFGDFEVYRFPRNFQDKDSPVVSRVENEVLSGRYSMLLPRLDAGGYRIVFPEYDLVANEDYSLGFRVKAAKPVRATIELYSGTENISRQTVSLKAGDSKADFLLRTSPGSGFVKDQSAKGYRIVLRIMSDVYMVIDEISLIGPGHSSLATRPWVELIPDNFLGVYGIAEAGTMRVASSMDSRMRYRIMDAVRDISLTGKESKPLGQDGIVNINTDKRGAYRVLVYGGAADDNKEALATRRYVVIDRTHVEPATTRYGIAMEEHGQKTHIDGRIRAADFYLLAAELGAGSVRIFTLAMPDIVSTDGIRYDFSQIDKALALCRENDLEPLVELGSNLPNRIPQWLLTSENRPDTIDLRRGLATKKLQQRLARIGGKHYLDLAVYEQYLHEVFKHLGDQVRYFEIWNEPGHKFLPQDYLKIARLTRKVQLRDAPNTKLVGYTSTKQPGRAGELSKSVKLPGFLDTLLSEDRAESIDVMSYHSKHAYKFLGDSQDPEEDETGYVDLIRKSIASNGIKRALPIWDTERGILWSSDRVVTDRSGMASYEVARRLPGIYAASMASGVERLFWFYMDSSTSTIARTAIRRGFFDANLEPMPHIAVYDALTQLIGDSRFVRKIERDDGLKIYIFENINETIMMAFNWRRQISRFGIEYPGTGYLQLDVMGNDVLNATGDDFQTNPEITVDGWPQYLVFREARANQVRVALQGD